MANIYLSGFMGCGKSSVGRQLARLMDRPFYDLDHEIERDVGKSIPEIFAEEGEPVFRAHEARVLRQMPEEAVIALGGGAPTVADVASYLREHGVTIYLDWPFEILYRRVAGDPNRPLARERDKMKRLYRERLPIYRQAEICWRSKPPHREKVKEVVEQIHEMLLQL